MEHKQWLMVYDMGHTVDGEEYDTYEEAKAAMENTYVLWEMEEIAKWRWNGNVPTPTAEQIESWNAMIDDCYCYVTEWCDDLDEYLDGYWGYNLSDAELKGIGWVEYSELMKEVVKND